MSVTDPPAQNVVGPLALMAAVGAGLVVTLTLAGPAPGQPAALVPVTEYVPAALTVMLAVVAPVLQT